MQPRVDGDGVELLAHAVDTADDADVVAPAKLVLEHCRSRKDPAPILAERVHEGAVIEFGHQRGT